jgi:serine protease Do
MKRYLKTLTGMAALLALLSQPSFAQDKEKEKEAKEAKEKDKSKNEEIIIRRKSDKDTKVTIEIRGDEVLVNGKPADEFEDENITIRKRRNTTVLAPNTPFRSQGGTWSFDGHGLELGDVAFLGVVTDDDSKGAKIEQVTDESAAEKAGLKKGDIITKIDESSIDSPDDVTKAIRKHKPEEKATITYLRDGKEQKATVTLGKRKSALHSEMFTPRINPNFNLQFDNDAFGRVYSYSGRGRLGVKAQDTEEGKGVKVIGIDDESIAEKSGLKEGDIITEFDGKTINDTDALAKAARESREKSSVTVKFNRDGKSQTAELKTPKKLKTTNL